jgi:hypothetical protein
MDAPIRDSVVEVRHPGACLICGQEILELTKARVEPQGIAIRVLVERVRSCGCGARVESPPTPA